MKFLYPIVLVLLCQLAIAQNAAPVLSNVTVSVSGGQVQVSYDITDAESNNSEVKLLVSADGGQTYLNHSGSMTGDIGYPVAVGTGKHITWDYDTISDIYSYSLRLVADDRQVPSIQTIVDQVDSVRLRNLLLSIQGIRHYQANPTHLEEIKDTIEARFTSANLQVSTQDFVKLGYAAQNILGRKAGLGKEDTTYILDAHFDSVNDAPGADDNGSGMAGVLEALCVLAPYHFNKSIRFIGFDFEETGLDGSIRYVQSGIKPWEKLQGVINYEMIGYYSNAANSQQVPAGFNILLPTQYAALQADSFRGNFIVNVGDAESGALVRAYDSLSQLYVPALKKSSINLPGNGTIASDFRRSDHAPFWDANYPAIMLTDGANYRNHAYHTAGDTIGNLSMTFMSNVVKGAVATLASLAELQNSTWYDAAITPTAIPRSTISCPVQLYPIPARSKLSVETGDCLGSQIVLQVMTTDGRIVLRDTITGRQKSEVSIDKLPHGNYFMLLQGEAGQLVRRFVKE